MPALPRGVRGAATELAKGALRLDPGAGALWHAQAAAVDRPARSGARRALPRSSASSPRRRSAPSGIRPRATVARSASLPSAPTTRVSSPRPGATSRPRRPSTGRPSGSVGSSKRRRERLGERMNRSPARSRNGRARSGRSTSNRATADRGIATSTSPRNRPRRGRRSARRPWSWSLIPRSKPSSAVSPRSGSRWSSRSTPPRGATAAASVSPPRAGGSPPRGWPRSL